MKKHGIKSGKNEDSGQLSKRQLEIRKRHLKEGVGFSKNMNKQELAAYKRFLVDQEIALKVSTNKRLRIYNSTTTTDLELYTLNCCIL